PAKLSEIAILVTVRHWTSHYEWYAHKRLALKAGLDPKIIDDIRDRRTPQFDDPKAKMIYDVAKSLHEGHGVAKRLYDEAVNVLSERGIVEIIGLCGYYTMVSMTLNTFEFGLPEGQVSELACELFYLVSFLKVLCYGVGAHVVCYGRLAAIAG